jgi:hypothetical protein
VGRAATPPQAPIKRAWLPHHAFMQLHADRPVRVSDMFRQRIDDPDGSPPHYPAASYHRGG